MHSRLLTLCSGHADELFWDVSWSYTGRWDPKDSHLFRRRAVMIEYTLVDPTPPNKASEVAIL
jgi:hypothetical protein